MARGKQLGPFGTFVMSIIFAAIGLGVLYYGYGKNKVVRASKLWPKAKAKIISSEVTSHRSTSGSGRKRRTSTTYKANIYYKYKVDGKILNSNRIYVMEGSSSNRSFYEDLVNEYPAGKKTKVAYNPDNIHYSLLKPGESGDLFILWIVGGLFSFFGGLMFLGSIKKFLTGR